VIFNYETDRVFSNDDFKFRQGICFYIAIPVTFLAVVNGSLYFVEGILRYNASKADDEFIVSSNNSQKPFLGSPPQTYEYSSAKSKDKQSSYKHTSRNSFNATAEEEENLWI
jgi:hypothetical protein